MGSSFSAVPRASSLERLLESLRSESGAGELEACRIFGDPKALVTDITEDSRRVTPGCLFVARTGGKVDGTSFVTRATSSGAVAVLCASGAGVSFEPRLEVGRLERALGICAQTLYEHPSRAVPTVGITGTNGKTTVACLVEQALRYAGRSVGRLGTLGFFVDDERLADSLTTPQPDQLARYLAEARLRGAKALVLEVSSHALSQERVAGVEFAACAFTNLSQDHLDYHGDMEAYFQAKARLFRDYPSAHRVLNVDDPWVRRLAEELGETFDVSARGKPARLSVAEATFARSGLEARVHADGEELHLKSSMLGQYNLENLLVAWGLVHSLGLSHRDAALCLGRTTGVPGRLERCDGRDDDIVVVVDYAHTPDALERALFALRELSFESVSCVFGCGGDRDRTKRPLMGAVAARGADRIYLTSDNPRSEDPRAILDDVRPGLSRARGKVMETVDRREAIERAIMDAPQGGVVLIAGKGHEDYQLISDQVLHFDDREEARAALSVRRRRS